MTDWSAVATLAILVAGSLGALALHSTEIAIFLAGAAAGYVARRNGKGEPHRRRSDPPGVQFDARGRLVERGRDTDPD